MRSNKYFHREPESVKTYGLREVCTRTAAGKREYTARTVEMWERQGGKCAICGKWVELNMAQYDHQDGRGFSGSHRDDRTHDEKGSWMNAAVCGECNSEKASRRFMWVNNSYVEVNKYKEVA